MSVYFVNMEAKVSVSPEPWRGVDATFERVSHYLNYLMESVMPHEMTSIYLFRDKLAGIAVKLLEKSVTPIEGVRCLHEWSHELAEARIQLRNGNLVTDNPYFGENFTDSN